MSKMTFYPVFKVYLIGMTATVPIMMIIVAYVNARHNILADLDQTADHTIRAMFFILAAAILWPVTGISFILITTYGTLVQVFSSILARKK